MIGTRSYPKTIHLPEMTPDESRRWSRSSSRSVVSHLSASKSCDIRSTERSVTWKRSAADPVQRRAGRTPVPRRNPPEPPQWRSPQTKRESSIHAFCQTRLTQRLKHRAMAIGAAALVLPLAAGIAGSAVAAAAPAHARPARPRPPADTKSCGCPPRWAPIKVQVQWAARGGNAALYLLDGLRARNDAQRVELRDQRVRPVPQRQHDPGDAGRRRVQLLHRLVSHPTSTVSRSRTSGRRSSRKELPDFLANYGVSRNNNAVLGLSMGGSAALTLAAYHRDQFKFAGSLSAT